MIAELSNFYILAIMTAATLVILVCGLRMTTLADQIADRTGLGEALIGGVLLGAATSLSGTIVSLTSALDGRASLAFANSIGGIAAQTVFLAVGDLVYRRANLEHASAEITNLFQGGMLILLLAIPFLASTTPEMAIFGMHPLSLAIPVLYVFGLIATRWVKENPMWEPVDTELTRFDMPDDESTPEKSSARLLLAFAIMAVFLALAGWAIARCGAVLSDRIGLSETLVGALMTAVITSLPELVTTLSAVRRGALQLAVGGIIGGNTFDTLFLTISDAGYRDGSIYHAIGNSDLFWNAVALVMTAILMLGLLLRQKQGTARIGFESVALFGVFGAAVALQSYMG
ncbi:cation:H+ antiporter [Cohaesibacter sp. ES.047]|uniref:sodium:calcium antiporter n=1 Tax=Cohaesibacter sp. ES.047 TaxID=1798205 RepID=UPI000BB82E2D|nr:cation transporter [Cohaesibacter sp. ES.047]SNY92960.1 cation:H+ antiporter [Cohaesibacter sp. ES.047]